ncbi:hypothetical protein E1B28_004556 [Marasmius oreades]|uniref:Uncharacterized protein n=1 Tax=Marasmius oreades TaxID=181124 RepID=A0A9P8AD41_9AGAR|nr:uncharacterized protein E1B28_004556 [Marasmius oreades]KAG7097184.1 hypothetical protein E1B28_004556 [Marasmius oreades]
MSIPATTLPAVRLCSSLRSNIFEDIQILDIFCGTYLGGMTASQSSATEELKNPNLALLRVAPIHGQFEGTFPTAAGTSTTQVHSPTHSSDRGRFVFGPLQEGAIGRTTVPEPERHHHSEGSFPEDQTQIISGLEFFPANTLSTHINESPAPSTYCPGTLANNVDHEPAQGNQSISYLNTTAEIMPFASQPSFNALDDQLTQFGSHDQDLHSFVEENHLDAPDFADTETDYHDLPDSSPLQEPVSVPPTSSPPIFTSSPCLSSQTSLSSSPDFRLDNDCSVGSDEDLGSVLKLGETSLSVYDPISQVSCSIITSVEKFPIPSVASPAWASSPPLLPSSDPIDSRPSSATPRTTTRVQEQGCSTSTAIQPSTSILLATIPYDRPSEQDVPVDSLIAPKPSVEKLPLSESSHKLADESKTQASGANGSLQNDDLDGFVAPTTNVEPGPKNTTASPVIATPVPRRSTFASQNKAFKKLITPFRSPAMKKTKMNDLVRSQPPSVTQEAFSVTRKLVSAPAPTVDSVTLSVERQRFSEKEKEQVDKKKHRTARAAVQFKSPLTATTAASVGNTSVRLTPTIQILERKVQLLKRAVKVKADREQEVLKDLIKIWTEAGREISYELFELAKDREGSGNSWSGVRKHEDSWEWSTQGSTKRLKMEGQAGTWGWDTSPSNERLEGQEEVMDVDEATPAQDEYEEKPESTIGTMLRQLGVDPVILGWNFDEGIFAAN